LTYNAFLLFFINRIKIFLVHLQLYDLKEKIRKVFNKTNDWYTGVFKLGMWLSRAKKYFPNSNNTIIPLFLGLMKLLLTLTMVQRVVLSGLFHSIFRAVFTNPFGTNNNLATNLPLKNAHFARINRYA
jgi:hypothetical protein